MTKYTVRFSRFALVGVVGFLGCSGGNASGGASDPVAGPQMTIHKDCLKTKCEVRQDDASSRCSDCLEACAYASYGCDSSEACEFSCSDPSPCGEWESECAVTGYEVTLPNNPSPEVAAACQGAIDHIEECGYEASHPKFMCDTFAATEQPKVTAQYDCVAKLSCEDLTTEAGSAGCSLPPSSFGDQFCSKMSAVCGEFCDGELLASLNSEGAWLRSDVIAAAMFCTQQASCDDAQECISAWANAVGI
jgi:hypothetical protein